MEWTLDVIVYMIRLFPLWVKFNWQTQKQSLSWSKVLADSDESHEHNDVQIG